MPIEFRCPSCNQQLRVPDTAAGKNAKCPKCSTVVAVPGSSPPADPLSAFPPAGGPPAPSNPFSPPPASPPAGGGFDFGNPAPKPPASNPFGNPAAPGSPFGAPPPAGGGGSFGAPPPSNPFGVPPAGSPFPPSGGGGNPFGGGSFGGGGNPFAGDPKSQGGNPNPYASPTGAYMPPVITSGPIGHQVVEVGPIMNHAMTVWQNNLGLLVGMTVIVAVVSTVIRTAGDGVEGVLRNNGDDAVVVAASFFFWTVERLVDIFLGIGQVQIMLKLLRYQPATIGDLFSGGPLFLPVLGLSILIFVALFFGFLLLIVPGILMVLWFWPCYYLVIDGKSTVLESFEAASKITEGNRLTTFVLGLLIIGIMLLGLLACCIGVLFAAPLAGMLLVTAYLMMSGQLPVQPLYAPNMASAPPPMYR